jgi:regulation of enolase protein 1 (concanavalin A-like superfamily)
VHFQSALTLLSLGLFAELTFGQLLQVDGTRIINSSNNHEVILNAVNFGNWMVMEGYMMNSESQAPAQHDWKEKLTQLVGANRVKTFYDTWLENHVTRADINQIKAWGFNAVRLPLHYEYFVNLGTPDVWNNQGFALLDNVISWCTSAGVYVIIDLHAAPGGQSSNSGISDYDSTKPSLWESAENRSKTVRLWDKISERYKNEAWVAGYDLINETNWNLPNGTLLRELFGELTTTIRANGDNHILFIEGNGYSNDYTGLTPAWDPQMVYVFHKYQSSADFASDIQFALDMRTSQNRPIWCGEHGENSNDNFTKMVELLRGQGIGMSWWPMKKYDSVNCPSKATFPPGYQDLLNYLGGTNPNLSATAARNSLDLLAESVLLANTQTQTEVLRAIFTQPNNRDTAPYVVVPTIPGTVVYAANYDQGMNGHAYSDTGWENVNFTTGEYTAWNERWTYRNGGVDIETCSDSLSNGYNVGFFKPTEWMKYTVDVTASGTYDIALRVANGSGRTSTLQIQSGDGTKTLATASVPNGGWGNWITITVTGGFSTTGVQSIRIANTGSSECNINSVRFTKTSNTIPGTTSVPVSVDTVSLKANNGGYLSWQSNSPYTLTCEATSETANAQFTLVDAGAGRTAFRASNGKYVRYSASDNKLYADATNLGSDEQFTLNHLNRSVAIQGPNSLFLTQNANDPVLCSKSIISGWEYFLMSSLSTTQGAPATPLGVAISNGTISWKSMAGATRYSVQRRTSSGGAFETIATDISATSFTDPSHTSGATNSYRIISYAGTYASQPSAEVGFVFSGLPTGWNQQDIGSVGLAGTTTFSGSTITLQGSGADIWETADGCHFLFQGISGDFVITARLASMSNTDYWAKAGLMVRESSSAGSKNVSLLVTPQGGGARMQWRNSQGGSTSDHELSGSNAPLWLRMTRSGNTLTGSQSDDGATWTHTHTVTLVMNSDVLAGLVVTSHKNDALNTAIFDSVSLTINKATATVTLGNLVATYNGSARAATATTVPAGLTVHYTYDGSSAAPTSVGSYAVVATIDDANYQGSTSGTLVITWSWNAFQNLWFTPEQISNTDVSSPTADANQDGLKNFFAYSSGISPWIQAKTENGGFPIVEIQSGFLTIAYTRLKQRFDFDCIPEVSSDLATWSSGSGFTIQTEVTPLDDVRERVKVRDVVPSENINQRFMRLRGVFLP